MPLTAEQYKTLIVTEVGDTSDGLVAGQIETLWTLYDATPALYLRYLRTKRKAIDLLLGRERTQVDFREEGALDVKLSQKSKHLQAMLDDVDAEIALVERKAGASSAPATGSLTTTTPTSPPSTTSPDANDARYRGDPYTRPGSP